MTARSKDPGSRAPKEEVPLSVNPAVREFVIASAVAKYASFLRAHCSAKSSRFSGLFERQRTRANRLLAETGGFEPPIRCDPYNGLANRRLQPLGHVSGVTVQTVSKDPNRTKDEIGPGLAPGGSDLQVANLMI